MSAQTFRTDLWGIVRRYRDVHGRWHAVSRETRDALRTAMGPSPRTGPPVESIRVTAPGPQRSAQGPGLLRLEDGGEVDLRRGRGLELPAGVHERCSLEGAHEGWWVAAPPSCPEPSDRPEWGWAVQLYAARSRRSWGIGDFGDLRQLMGKSGTSSRADFALLNPLGAPLPCRPQEDSPYSPSSRLFLNPLYLRIEEVPGAGASAGLVEPLAAAGRALNERRTIERDEVFGLKMRALEGLWTRFRGDARFERYRREQGDTLRRFATFNVLAERYGAGWSEWPNRYRHPDLPDVRTFGEAHGDRVRFHEWVQWLLDEQLARAARVAPLMLDVPIGVRADGFDAWLWQDLMALDAAVGVPPDEYNTLGQNWGLPPFVPHRLRESGYLPWRMTLRAMLRHARGLRVDHVMGLFRLYWIPGGASAADGAFVRYSADEILAVLAIESRRAGATVVGEDLGTVEAGVRPRLRRRNVLSYRLLWFERTPPEGYPPHAMAALSTHDLFTVAGLWTGSDLEAQERLRLNPNSAGTRAIRRRVGRLTGLESAAPVESVVVEAHRVLRRAPCRLFTATLDDALGVEERPNMPGTVRQWPNWRLALPQPIESLPRHPLAKAVARVMNGDPPAASAGIVKY